MSYATSIDAPRARIVAAGAALLTAWVLVYRALPGLAAWATYRAADLEPGTRLAASVEFFLYETPKVLLLLLLVVFGVGVVRTFFTPERTRRLLAGRREVAGNVLAAAPRHRHAVLLVLGGAALHRLRLRRGFRSA